MDSKAAFAFGIIALAIAGLWALIVGWVSINNGQLVVGQPSASSSATPSGAAGGTAPVAGAGGSPIPYTGGGGWGETNPGSPSLSGGNTPQQVAMNNVLGSTSGGLDISQIYDPSSLSLVQVNPYGALA